MKRIAVYCASSEGANPIYMETAYTVGKVLAENGYELVYGGASVGCMGAVAKGALENNGNVIGVLPQSLNKREIAATQLTELIMVESMHERKLKMNELCAGTISLPGGFGTFEELFEMITWGQLALHRKPTTILNVNSYYDHLVQQMQVMKNEGLLKEKYLNMLLVDDNIHSLLTKMENYKHPEMEQWLTEKTS